MPQHKHSRSNPKLGHPPIAAAAAIVEQTVDELVAGQACGMAANVNVNQRRRREDLTPVTCCMPTGCLSDGGDIVIPQDPGDAVRVYCNNEACVMSRWMHGECFDAWEQHVLSFLRTCGRARSWSEKQRLQNLWTKKGYDLAYKACDCKCGRGHLRKDLDYLPPPRTEDRRQRRNKKKGDRPVVQLQLGKAGGAASHGQVSGVLTNGMRLQQHHQQQQQQHYQLDMGSNQQAGHPMLRVRTGSFSSTGSTGSSGSPPSSAGSGTPPLTPGKKGSFTFFADAEQAAAGNIFKRRTNFSSFMDVLPRHQQNAYHIKMEDEGPHGNDETRCFVLTNLSAHQVRDVSCVVCQSSMPVFDKYPLIDGSFFLSPQRYNTDLQVLNDHRMLYLNAVCMKCLEGRVRQLRCKACRSPWMGSAFMLGSMYSYDIFAALPCCAQRLTCKNCHVGILDPSCGYQFFSEYSKVMECPHCGTEDCHFIRPIEDTFTLISRAYTRMAASYRPSPRNTRPLRLNWWQSDMNTADPCLGSWYLINIFSWTFPVNKSF